MKPDPQYEYADGSANLYVITSDSLEYIPVKPEESSTGTYSGGEPANIKITAAQYSTLQQLFEEGIRATESHTEHREKMTGHIIKRTPTATVSVILKSGTTEMVALEKELKALLSR